jgi:hypothetical protein
MSIFKTPFKKRSGERPCLKGIPCYTASTALYMGFSLLAGLKQTAGCLTDLGMFALHGLFLGRKTTTISFYPIAYTDLPVVCAKSIFYLGI